MVSRGNHKNRSDKMITVLGSINMDLIASVSRLDTAVFAIQRR